MTTPEKRDVNLVSLLWAGPESSAEVSALHASLFDQPWDSASLARLLEHPGATTLIARTGFPKATVGFVLGQVAADEAEIISIGVAKEWQGVGLGKRLVEGLERALKRAGAKRIFLEVAEDNTAARALYEGHGFTEATRRKGYYPRAGSPAVDALVMSKALG
jgi:ribosomal-protein-alanine N-acetyltransferase